MDNQSKNQVIINKLINEGYGAEDIDNNFDIPEFVREAEDYFFENEASTAELRYDGLKYITVSREELGYEG